MCTSFLFAFFTNVYIQNTDKRNKKKRRGTQIVDKEANMVLGKATEHKNEKERYAGTVMVPGTHMSLSLLK